jgi:choline-sulfatase
MPTFAGLLALERPPGLRGTDLTPLLRDPHAAPVQDEVLFTFDDMHAGTGRVREVLPATPKGSHPTEYELYDLHEDPYELHNLANPEHPRHNDPAVAEERDRLAAKLARVEDELARPAA